MVRKLLLVAMLASGPAYATEVRTLGMNDMTCADWTRDQSRELVHSGELLWVLGYLSGTAVATSRNLLSEGDIPLIDTAMRVQCAGNPGQPIPQAALSLVLGLAFSGKGGKP